MVNKIAVAGAALMLTAMTAVPGGAEKISAPRMVLEETDFDFQKVEEGDILEHDFIVRNEGDQPLEIKKVTPG
jgi:hypothetical protein